jgi:hypothetical protein
VTPEEPIVLDCCERAEDTGLVTFNEDGVRWEVVRLQPDGSTVAIGIDRCPWCGKWLRHLIAG